VDLLIHIPVNTRINRLDKTRSTVLIDFNIISKDLVN